MKLGIRREDKSRFERRVPLIPYHVKYIHENYRIKTYLQSSKIRIFTDQEYLDAGAEIKENLADCELIIGIKEMPIGFFKPDKTYIFFSHIIKGQKHNMPMLKDILSSKCNLIDYEKVVDESGRRLIFFGRYAGAAGMIDTLWAYGKKLNLKGIYTPFKNVKKAYKYMTLQHCKSELRKIGKEITKNGLPDSITPFVCGISGYGHVSKGAQEIINCLPNIVITPDQLSQLKKSKKYSKNHIYKVVFREFDLVKTITKKDNFELNDYYNNPHKYKSKFNEFLPDLSVIVNCIFWTPAYPRLVTKNDIKILFDKTKDPKLKIIDDISCDINGSIELTSKITEPDNPAYTYDPYTGLSKDGFHNKGIVIIARDNLPAEIPADSSREFSQTLVDFIPKFIPAINNGLLIKEKLPISIRKALIVYQGKLTNKYKYLTAHIK